MGSILSEQESSLASQKNFDQKDPKIEYNWEIIEKIACKQILKSKRTSLIVQRYWFQMQNYQDFDHQSKLFQWRNNNPNSQFMVNILSVNKDESLVKNQSYQCSSTSLCPSEKLSTKVYIVTERILKLGQVNDLLKFQFEIENRKDFSKTKSSQATQLKVFTNQKKTYEKMLPFINIKLNSIQSKRILKDWIRGIQVLCYKFGYFRISYDHLGITTRKRGNVWISENYSLNHLETREKIQVCTAQQKFRYEKQTIQKIMVFIENASWFKSIFLQFKNKIIQRFDEFCDMLDNLCLEKNNKNEKAKKHQPYFQNNNNSSLFVEHASFMNLNCNTNFTKNNSSFFMFDNNNILKKANSNQRIVLLQNQVQKKNHNNLINSSTNKNLIFEKQLKRSNTGEKVSYNISPQSKHNLNFVNSNHKNCGKQTAPTNQLGHSSSLQSVHNQFSNALCQEQLKLLKKQGSGLFKTQNNKYQSLNKNEALLHQKPSSSPSNKIYFYHNNKHTVSSQPYIFRSQNYQTHEFHSPRNPYKIIKSPRQLSKKYPQKQLNQRNYHNLSIDQNNMVGPYKTDRFYSNLKKEKIALVDSMVMVHEQSQQIQQDLHNLSGTKIVMEESIILMGREDPLLKSPRAHNNSFY